MGWLIYNMMILKVSGFHSKDLAYLLKDSWTRGHLLISEVMAGNNKLLTCKKVDQVILTTDLTFIQMELKEMSIH